MSLRRFQYKHGMLPYIPLKLSYAGRTIQRQALIDSGSSHNLMPYQVGLDLGLSWEAQTFELPEEDAYDGDPVVGIQVFGCLKPFPAIPLVFGWINNDKRPLILGHVNFFLTVDVHFYDIQGFLNSGRQLIRELDWNLSDSILLKPNCNA